MGVFFKKVCSDGEGEGVPAGVEVVVGEEGEGVFAGVCGDDGGVVTGEVGGLEVSGEEDVGFDLTDVVVGVCVAGGFEEADAGFPVAVFGEGGHGGGQGWEFMEKGNMTISEVNAMGKEDFVEIFGGVYECSGWVAEAVVGERPFGGVEGLMGGMRRAVDGADEEVKLGLLRAHPDLAGKLGVGALTVESCREQVGVGLDRLGEEELRVFTELNEAYRGRFGFPFIICVGRTDKAGILRAFRERLLNEREEEMVAAVGEVHEIARLRLEVIFSK